MKKKVVTGITLTLLFVGMLTLAFNVQPVVAVDWWPMFRHDLSHTGYSTSTAPNTNNVLWSYTTGGSVSCSSPAVADGKVFVGSKDYKVYCLNAETGAHIWNYTTGDQVRSSPAVADGKVYVGSDDHKVYCLDASTGAQIWSYPTGHQVFSSPAVVDGKVYVGSRDWKVYCLNASAASMTPNEREIWNYTTGDWVFSSPAVADGKVYVGSDDYKVYCLDASTGAHIWNYTTGNRLYSSPAVVDGKVFVGSWDDRVYCLNASTGAKIWSYTTGGSVSCSSPAVADGKVFVGSMDYRVYCLNASTGDFIWSYKTGEVVWSSPTVADGVVFIGSDDHNVYAFGPPDEIPPTTLIQIGSPNYTTIDMIYVTPETPFTLIATDNPGGSGVATTWYRIRNTTFTSDWTLYSAPFNLSGLTDDIYTIDFYSIDNAGNVEDPPGSTTVTLFSWNYVFEDSYGRGTMLKINTAHKFFQFITPDKDYGIRGAKYMRLCRRAIIMLHKDSELVLITLVANTKLDFCVAMAWNIQTRTGYFLIDRVGIEN